MKGFSEALLQWYTVFGRKSLPWQHPKTTYRVWVSEIMLQQTQVKTVIPYFLRFLEHFPTLESLAQAEEDQVLSLWSGLGYYSRARNLHKTAQILAKEFSGIFPEDPYILEKLPGIGLSTASAITSIAFNKYTPILDANVIRVLCRHFTIEEDPSKAKIKAKLWQLAKECMSPEQCGQYTQAIMDLGALLCTPKNPQCEQCPLHHSCLAYKNQAINKYPFKRLKKALPNKDKTFLLLYKNSREIYLEKNPPVGIWGGLWSIPSFTEENLSTYLSEKYALKSLHIGSMDTIKHNFSHFCLNMRILLVNVSAYENQVKELPGKWLSANKAATYGIPKPIRTIIERFNIGEVANHRI